MQCQQECTNEPISLNRSRTEKQIADLPSPPGYTSSVGQVNTEGGREADASLVVKVIS